MKKFFLSLLGSILITIIIIGTLSWYFLGELPDVITPLQNIFKQWLVTPGQN